MTSVKHRIKTETKHFLVLDIMDRSHAHRYHKVFMKKTTHIICLRVLVRDVFDHHRGTTVSRLGNGFFVYDEPTIDDTVLFRRTRMHLRPLLVLLAPFIITQREVGFDRFSLNRLLSSQLTKPRRWWRWRRRMVMVMVGKEALIET